jgi:hypothetical protein
MERAGTGSRSRLAGDGEHVTIRHEGFALVETDRASHESCDDRGPASSGGRRFGRAQYDTSREAPGGGRRLAQETDDPRGRG